MNEQLNKNNFEHLCKQHNQPLNLVCLDEECSELRGLICSHCWYFTQKPPVKSLAFLLHEIWRDSQSEPFLLPLFAGIDHAYSEAILKVPKVNDKKSEQMIIEAIDRYYRYLKKQVEEQLNSSQKIKSVLSLQELSDWIMGYHFEEREEKQKQMTNMEVRVSKRMKSFYKTCDEFQEFVKSGQQLEKILLLFRIEDKKKIKYVFSSQNIHKDIILVSKISAKVNDGYQYRVAAIDPPIRKQGGKTFKRTCHFVVKKATGVIGVGACYIKKIAGLSYIFSAYSQHGCYFVMTNGYSYNESDPQFNSKKKNWAFIQGDAISVTIDPQEKKIHYSKEQNTFSYGYEERSEYDFCFAIVLCSAEDQIQISES